MCSSISYPKNLITIYRMDNLKKDYDKGRFILDYSLQRGSNQWSKKQKQLLISSVFEGIVIPPIYINAAPTDAFDIEQWEVLDGKQRLETIIEFMNDGFATSRSISNSEIAGQKYSELPERFKNVFDASNFAIYKYENAPKEKTRENFIRLNNGKPLSTTNKYRPYYVNECNYR